MKLRSIDKISIIILNIIALPLSILAQESVLPRPFEVYGGTIGTIDAIQVPGDTNKTRVFASTDSANSVFYADVDHSSAAPLGTNFIFRVVPDLDANANFGAPDWIAAHQQSGKIFVGCSSGLLSCTTSAGSLITNIPAAISFVLIQGSNLFAVNDPTAPETPKTLYYGTLSSSGSLTMGAPLAASFTGTVSLAISPLNNKVYVLCNNQTSFVLLKSSDDYSAFSSATTFSEVPTATVTVSPVEQAGFGPDGRLLLGGGSSTLKVAYSDDDGATWTNVDTGGLIAGGGSGLNIVCNGSAGAYEVYYGTAVSTNKGVNGSWIGLPRPGGYRPPSMHVNAGCTKIDPNNSQFVYLTTDKGIGGSANAGTDVVELNNGLLAFQINDIDALSDKSVAWIASKAGIRIATSFSTTPVWTDGDFPDAIVYACAMDSDDPYGMTGYAGSCRLYRTTTGGGTNTSFWTQVWRWEDYNVGDGEIRAVKAKGNFIALGYYSYAQTSPSGAVFVSSTAGSNWTALVTNVNINDLFIRDEGGAGIIYAAASKSTASERGGIYRIESSSVALDLTNDVNIRKMAEDSVGGIYASGTLPETAMPGRYCVVAYYRDTNAVWSMLPTNGLPGGFNDGDILGRGLGPVITVGKDSATNDVPVLAVMRTIYYLPYGGSSWVTITNYPNGTQIKTLFYDELMVGTTIGLYGQGINAQPTPRADPAMVVSGNWYLWLSAMGYQMSGPFNFGVSAEPVAADFDADGKADPAMVDGALWYIWFTRTGYQLSGGPWNFGVAGLPVAADFDGDRKADPAMVVNTLWYIWFSGASYQLCGGPWNFGVAGYPVAADFDGDGKGDPCMVVDSLWYIWFSGAGYQLCGGPWNFGVEGIPVAGDFDADGKADPAMVVNTLWYIWFSGAGYQLCGGPWNFGVAGYPVAADFDGR